MAPGNWNCSQMQQQQPPSPPKSWLLSFLALHILYHIPPTPTKESTGTKQAKTHDIPNRTMHRNNEPFLLPLTSTIRNPTHHNRADGQNTAANPCLDVLFENRLFDLSVLASLPLPEWWPFDAASKVIVEDGLESVLARNPPSSGG